MITRAYLSPSRARRKLAVSRADLHALLGRHDRYDADAVQRILDSRPRRRTRGPLRTVSPQGLTPKQAASKLGISQASLAYAANAGAIPRVKRGRGWTRYLESDLVSKPVQAVARKIRNHERQVLAAARKREQAAMAAKLEEATT